MAVCSPLMRQQLLAFLLDEYAARVEGDFSALLHKLILLVVSGGYVEESADREGHIRAVVQHVLVGDLGVWNLLPEALVLVDGHLTFLTVPDGAETIHDLAVQLDRVGNELTELLDRLVDEAIGAELTRFRQQLEGDSGAALEVEVISI